MLKKASKSIFQRYQKVKIYSCHLNLTLSLLPDVPSLAQIPSLLTGCYSVLGTRLHQKDLTVQLYAVTRHSGKSQGEFKIFQFVSLRDLLFPKTFLYTIIRTKAS